MWKLTRKVSKYTGLFLLINNHLTCLSSRFMAYAPSLILSELLTAYEGILLTNPGNLSLAKGIAKLHIYLTKN